MFSPKPTCPRPVSGTALKCPYPILRLHIILWPHTRWARELSAFVPLNFICTNAKHRSPEPSWPQNECFSLRKSHWVSEVGVGAQRAE